MIVYAHSPRDRFLPRPPRTRVRRCFRSRRSPRPWARPSMSTARADPARALPRDRRRRSAATRIALHYALKANSSLALARLLAELGSAADANSSGRSSSRSRPASRPPTSCSPASASRRAELECAVPLGLKAINVESAGELARIEAIAARLGVRARVALRVNPDIDAKSHPHISTGLKINKFGVRVEAARELSRRSRHARREARRRPRARRIADHHASNRWRVRRRLWPISLASCERHGVAARVRRPRRRSRDFLRRAGCRLAARLRRTRSSSAVRSTGLPIVIEPGRAMVGPAGALVARSRHQAAHGRRATSPCSTPA